MEGFEDDDDITPRGRDETQSHRRRSRTRCPDGRGGRHRSVGVGIRSAAAALRSVHHPRLCGNVPTATDVLGFELGTQEVTSDEAETYLRAVDDASTESGVA